MFRTKYILPFVLLFTALASFGCSFVSPRKDNSSAGSYRIQFDVKAVEENYNQRQIVSETTIEGLPGTDFNINLKTERFTMQAKFLTDLTDSERIDIRTKLNTRRLYGYSERQLPLYEEDAQSRRAEIGFGEKVVLLPFGKNGDAESLKIEITPKILPASDATASGEPLKINIDKPDLNGEITVEAFKIPHRFKVEAVLLADGREVARGAGDCLLEDAREIVLQTNERADPEIAQSPFAVKLEVNKYTRNPPTNLIGVNFEVYRSVEGNLNQTRISTGAGVGVLDSELSYSMNRMPSGKKYELKFKISLGEDEHTD